MKELQEMGFDEASSECALNLEDWNVVCFDLSIF